MPIGDYKLYSQLPKSYDDAKPVLCLVGTSAGNPKVTYGLNHECCGKASDCTQPSSDPLT